MSLPGVAELFIPTALTMIRSVTRIGMFAGITHVVSYAVIVVVNAGVTPTGLTPEITVVVRPSSDRVRTRYPAVHVAEVAENLPWNRHIPAGTTDAPG